MFLNRNLIIATKHGKEQVIAPLFEKGIGVKCIIEPDLDTDSLGTFTGEVERKDDVLTTVRKKGILAMNELNVDLAIASEGSFGPHPTLFFAHADEEFLLFIDRKNNLEIVVKELSLETNFNADTLNSIDELNAFAQKAKFPSHALILRKSEKEFIGLEKGITTWEKLWKHGNELLLKYGSLYVETDMRAHLNPTRMQVIEKAAQKLLLKVNSLCPNCQTPGFGITAAISGLPCEWCASPTRSVLAHVYCCEKCNFKQEHQFPYGKLVEDPMYCDRCNP